jgi:hypothetical protein
MKRKIEAQLQHIHNYAYTWAMGHVVVEMLWMMYGFLLQILHKWK